MVPIKDGLDQFWRQKRKPKHARYVGRWDRLSFGQIGNGRECARLQHPLPAKRARQRLDQSGVGPVGLRGPLRQLHLLAPATPWIQEDNQ